MRIISTQIPDQFEKLKTLLNNEVELLNIPMIEIETSRATLELLNKLKEVVNHNWVIFTSMRGVQSFFRLYDKTGYEKIRLNHLKFACIGESTNKELNKFGFNAVFINPGNTSKEFSSYLISNVLTEEDHVFLPLGTKANDYLPTTLADFCRVTRVNVYKIKGLKSINENVLRIIKNDEYNLLLITSPSAIENFIKLTVFKPELNQLKIASIGATTSEVIESFGYKPVLTASKSNLKTLTKEILQYLHLK